MIIQTQQDMEKSPLIIAGTGSIRLWELRHSAVQKILDKNKAKKILDIGCSDAKFIQRLSRSVQYSLLAGLDIDHDLLTTISTDNIYPEGIQHNYIYDRQDPLIVQLFQGDATMPLSNIKQSKFDALTLIEIIEHLDPKRIQSLNQTLFGYYEVNTIIITTPNKDFNTYFKFEQSKMRHWDHKFEWTQQQFVKYCQDVKQKYSYSYQLFGVGTHTTEGIKNGYCSQGAIFKRNKQQISTIQNQMPQVVPQQAIKIKQIEYPHWKQYYKYGIMKWIIQSCLYKSKNDPQDCYQSIQQIIEDSQQLKKIINISKASTEQIQKLVKQNKYLVINENFELAYNYDYFSESEEDEENSQNSYNSYQYHIQQDLNQKKKVKNTNSVWADVW